MRIIAAVMAAALLSSGCSWLGVQRLPAYHQELSELDCTTSVVAPVLDVLAGGVSLAVAKNAAAGIDDRNPPQSAEKGTTMLISVALAVASVFSAGYGFVQTYECREAKDQLVTPHAQPQSAMTPAGCDAQFFFALARAGTSVHEGPDTQTRVVATLPQTTFVCAADRAQGFGLRKVTLGDGTTGFVLQSALTP